MNYKEKLENLDRMIKRLPDNDSFYNIRRTQAENGNVVIVADCGGSVIELYEPCPIPTDEDTFRETVVACLRREVKDLESIIESLS